jgi:hypothetical protein
MTNTDKSDKSKQDKADDGLPDVGTLSEAEADQAEAERNEQLEREANASMDEETTHYNAHLDAGNTDVGTVNAPADAHERAAEAEKEAAKAEHTREAKR